MGSVYSFTNYIAAYEETKTKSLIFVLLRFFFFFFLFVFFFVLFLKHISLYIFIDIYYLLYLLFTMIRPLFSLCILYSRRDGYLLTYAGDSWLRDKQILIDMIIKGKKRQVNLVSLYLLGMIIFVCL